MFRDARLLEVPGSHPAVYGTIRGPAGSPRILLYAHHDVQPPGRADLWESPPFEPTQRGGRLFGRGTADDKAGIAVHLAAIGAWAGRPPLDVAVFVEGEEETGSAHLPEFISSYKELLQADAVVIADCSNWAIGEPTLITSLRGIVDCAVEVRTLDHAVHSGKYGGPVPDALTALCRLIATLHYAAGTVAVEGLRTGPPHAVPTDPARLREVTGMRPGVQLLGEGTPSQQMWARPAVECRGHRHPGPSEPAAPGRRHRPGLRRIPSRLRRHLGPRPGRGRKRRLPPADRRPRRGLSRHGPAADRRRRPGKQGACGERERAPRRTPEVLRERGTASRVPRRAEKLAQDARPGAHPALSLVRIIGRPGVRGMHSATGNHALMVTTADTWNVMKDA